MWRKSGSWVTGIVLALAVATSTRADVAATASPVQLDITAATLPAALLQFSQQTGLQLLFPTDRDATDLRARVVRGTYTPSEALEQLLRNSGLTFRFVNARTVSVTWSDGR